MDVVAVLTRFPPLRLEGLPDRARHPDQWPDFLRAREIGEVYPLLLGKDADLDLLPRAPKGQGGSSGLALPKESSRVALLHGGAVRCWVPLVGIMHCTLGSLLVLHAAGAATVRVGARSPTWFPGIREPWWTAKDELAGPAWSTAAPPPRPLVELQAFFVCRRGRGKGCEVVRPCACGRVADLLCDRETGEGTTCDAPICAVCALAIGPDRHLCPACAALGTVPSSVEASAPAKPTGAQKGGKRGKAPPPAAPAPEAPATTSAQRGLFG